MEIPAELRSDPPPSTLAWIASAFGPRAEVTAVRRLANAWAAAVHAIDVDGGGEVHELVVRRWVRGDVEPDPHAVENEAAVLSVLVEVPGLRAPRLVATDPDGNRADAPALVMTRLAGRDVLSPPDLDSYLDGLVATLHSVHDAPVATARLGPYRPWGLDTLADPPPWTRRPDVWRRGFDIARMPPPAYTPVFIHRDFHPGNVLWHHGRVLSGVVDWTSACAGPAAVDVADCRNNLTVLFGLEVADEFSRRFGPVDDLAWFDLLDIVGWGEHDTWRWHDAGRADITDDSLARGADEFIAQAVTRLE